MKIERQITLGILDATEGRPRAEVTSSDPRLGRLAHLDARSRNFPVRSLIASGDTPRGRKWYNRLKLDQGQTPACTGFSRTYDLAMSPNPLRLPNRQPFDFDFAFALYKLAQQYDEWPGQLYDGSSVLGAFKAAQALGYIGEYRWAFGIDDAVLALSHIGPLVVGTDWLDGMFDPKPSGLVEAHGAMAGGHAYSFDQVIVTRESMRHYLGKGEPIREGDVLLGGEQSWGTSWGNNGRYLFWASSLEYLLKGAFYPGEAAVTTQALRRG